MPKEDLSALHTLPPEERIRKLKELEKERRKELAEAQEKIRESEEEIRERRKWLEKVPLPEFAKEDLEGLSEEAKQVLKERKGIKEKKKEDRREPEEREEVEETEEIEEVKNVKRDVGRVGTARRSGKVSLEETLARERTELPSEVRAVEYDLHLASRRPMQEIYRELAGIREEAKERGYVTGEQAWRAEYLAGAIEEKFRSAEEGRYTDFTQEVAEKGILSQEIASKVRGLYRGQKEQYQK